MTECYKLLFDLSLYYTVFGYYLSLTVSTPPSAACYLALAASILLDSLLRTRRLYETGARLLRFLPILLPVVAVFFRPTFPQILHVLPIWAYLGFSMFTDRVQITYAGFRSHFGFGLWMLLLMVFGPLFPGRVSEAFIGAVPYLIGMLVCGVCLLRMLREQRPDGLRQGIYMALFILLCAVLTVGQAPQLLLRGLGLLYRFLIAPVILAAAVLIAVLIYGLYAVFTWLISFARGEPEPLQLRLEGAAETLGVEEEVEMVVSDLHVLRTVLIILGAAALLFLLYRLFRRLLGKKAGVSAGNPWRERESDRAAAGSSRRKPGVFRPRDPRLAIRWDYAHFIAECRRRGVPVREGMTASELAVHSAAAFPGADTAAFTAIYLPARYDLSGPVTAEEARHSGELWRTLKRKEDPSEPPGKRRNR